MNKIIVLLGGNLTQLTESYQLLIGVDFTGYEYSKENESRKEFDNMIVQEFSERIRKECQIPFSLDFLNGYKISSLGELIRVGKINQNSGREFYRKLRHGLSKIAVECTAGVN